MPHKRLKDVTYGQFVCTENISCHQPFKRCVCRKRDTPDEDKAINEYEASDGVVRQRLGHAILCFDSLTDFELGPHIDRYLHYKD